MKAYEITQFGFENLSIVERAAGKPGPTDAVVKMHATSLNYRDVMIIEGTYNPRLRLPLVPFSDGAGEIVELGSEVTRWKVGDRVCPIFMQGWIDNGLDHAKSKTALGGDLDGCLREFGIFDQGGLVRVPEHLSFDEAACLPCAAVTAWNALMVSGCLKAGETVLIQGTGGVAIFALQFAKFAGAKVMVISSTNEKLDHARRLGADETINYREHPDWDKVILEVTDRRGVDHVIEVGGAATLQRSMRATKIGGHIVVLGVVAGKGEFSHVPIFMKALRVQGIFVGSRKMFEDMNKVIDKEQIRPVIDRKFQFETAREALLYMKRGAHFGKIVVGI